jgi:TRAP-type C4-dicarboxylate transport system permease small subunit
MAPPRLRKAIDLLVTLAVAFALFVMLWQGILLMQRIANQRLAGLDIPIIWAYAAIPVGAAFSLFALVCRQVEARSATGNSSATSFEGDTI